MEPDKEFLAKLWGNRWTKLLIIFGLGWQIISGLKEPAGLLYKEIIIPSVIYLAGSSPNPDDISNERHSFLSGYYSYEIFSFMKRGDYSEWPSAFKDTRYRLESSLVALKVPNASLANEIDPSKILDAMEKYQRLRHHTESFLDNRSLKELSAFHLGLNLALLLEESSNSKPSHETIKFYLAEAKNNLEIIRKNTPNRIQTLEFERFENCCAGYQNGLVSSFIELKKFYGAK